ncbi:DUF6992 family protein [Pedobacter cryophilus]|uniref:Uncharacterized protein n=1 Tax=Pedobacter cryophilus TaxID=2571271 RepID=A0A4U1BUS8_9SPHI|nr:hypothetical protein [Pedobacter cryophilus]TKB96012.1 hypothetical protein FA046_15190 [Pedobacter cryophilus]
MKKFIFFILIVFATPAFSQDKYQKINEKRIHINSNGMKVLGGWALTNLTIGGLAYFNSSGKKKYFNQMNVMWNVVNLGLATAGYFGAKADLKEQLSFAQSIHDQQKIEKILLLNAGLDVGYMATGLFLNERGIRKSSDRLKGYGQSLILQGAFLLVFDGAMYAIHQKNGKGFDKFLNQMSFNFDGKQVGILYKLN